MTIVQVDNASLARFLDLAGWTEALSTDPLPGPSPNDPGWSLQAELERIRANVRVILTRESGLSLDAPFALRKPTCIAAILGRATVEQYAVLSELCDILRNHHIVAVPGFEDAEPWNAAIAATRRVRHFSGVDLYTLDRAPRCHAVGEACRRLEQRGFAIGVTAQGVSVDAPTLAAICVNIEDRVRRLGGRQVIDMIFRWFEAQKRVYEGTLLYGRNVSQVPKLREPSIPWHFLYNIALKHLDATPSVQHFAKEATELAELARDMTAVFDVEVYDKFDGMTVGPANFHQVFLDHIVYDELFAFQQWQPKVADRVLSSWLRHLAAAGCGFPLATRAEWEALGSSLIARSQLTKLTITHPAEHAGPALTAQRAAMLFRAISSPLDQLNKGYATPLDTAKRNSPYFPLYMISPDLYAVPPRGMAARAVFERIYALLRDARILNLESMMGVALEDMTREAVQLTGHVPRLFRSQYRPAGQRKGEAPLEVDLAEELDDRIVFMECKKKPLTNAARAGNVLSAAVDFAAAFLIPLVQINRHEEQLRAGGITFIDGQTLVLDGRHIQRVAVTMTDHGSMQDRMFLRAVLIGLWGATLTAHDPKLQPVADKVNAQLQKVTQGITALAGQANSKFDDFVHRYVFSSWWFSIDQLTFLCEHTRDLRRATSPVGGVIFGTGDLMNEIAHSDRMGLLRAKD
jgi:hypothetical protein